jgi:hypothetical protein
MPKGICKLCLRYEELRRSHFVPRALYENLRAPGYEPVQLTSKVVRPTSRQTADYLLCNDCEQLLSKNGERWVLPRLAKYNASFPLYDLLTEKPPVFDDGHLAVYATAGNPDVDRESLINFAIGLFWKASVHPWSGERQEARIDLGEVGGNLRQFLLGQAALAENVALVLILIPPPVSLIATTDPIRGSNPEFANYHSYLPGLFMNLCVGADVRERMKGTCIVSNPHGPVTVQDVTPDIRAMLQAVGAGAYKTKKLVETQAEIIVKQLHKEPQS